VEDHTDELKQKTVAYINTDGSGRGFLGVGGSHSLQAMVREVAGEVTDPQRGVSIADRRNALDLVRGGDGSLTLYALGSGSDYTPFFQYAGIASLNLGFGGENGGGDYHTIYDTYSHFVRFKDPGFAYGVALAKTAGRLTLRMANADVLPFEFVQWQSTVSTYLDEVMALVEDKRKEVEKHNRLVGKNAFELAADPTRPFQKPVEKEPIPYLDFSPLQNTMASLKTKAEKLSMVNPSALSGDQLAAYNSLLMKVEQQLIRAEGLPRRPWFKHQLYAPGFYTGYGVKTLPGVREAIEQDNWQEAQEQIRLLATTLHGFGLYLDKLLAVTK
ncbi:MAG: folate hydrolase, partial [Cyclobacteriaceae bacterium]|nr:folate hydrolase [Cyclobacteriaceae bacterium]